MRHDVDSKLRREALLRLAQWKKPPARDPVVGAWRPLEPRDAGFLRTVLPPMALGTDVLAEPELAEVWIQACVAGRVLEAVPILALWVQNEKASGATRAAALRGLSKLSDGSDLPEAAQAKLGELATSLSASGDRELRAAAMEVLPKLAPESALELALALLHDGDVRERRAALRALGRLEADEAGDALAKELDRQAAGLFPPELALDLALAAEARKSSKLDKRLAALRAPRAVEPLLAPYVDSLYGGNAQAGRKLFRSKSELACLRCHKIEDGEGGDVGSDLRELGSRASRAQILEAICDPNRSIAQGFRSTILFLKDDTRFEGRVLSEDATTLKCIDAQAELHTIDVAEIEERREGQSSMPADLTKHLSREEMRDLIEFLARL